MRNLALAGGSPVTGLEIVNARSELPKIVLIEANVLSRPVDQELVQKFSGTKAGGPWFFRPIRFAVAGYENWLHAPPSHAQLDAEIARVTEAPPAEFDNRIYLARAMEQANAENPEQATRKNVVALKRLISSLNQGNSRALLFELPYPEELENSTFASVTRGIVHAAFPDPSFWVTIGVSHQELRWNDGSHLDERSAMLVARALEHAVSPVDVDTAVPPPMRR